MGNVNDDTGHYEGALLEEIRDNVKQIAESVTGLNTKVDGIDARLVKVEKNAELIPVIKAAVTDQAQQLTDHEARVTKLEETAV